MPAPSRLVLSSGAISLSSSSGVVEREYASSANEPRRTPSGIFAVYRPRFSGLRLSCEWSPGGVRRHQNCPFQRGAVLAALRKIDDSGPREAAIALWLSLGARTRSPLVALTGGGVRITRRGR